MFFILCLDDYVTSVQGVQMQSFCLTGTFTVMFINVRCLYLTIKLLTLLTTVFLPPSLSCPPQAVLGGEGPLLWLGLQAAQMHHTGGQLQHEPVEAEHHCLSGESHVTAAFTTFTCDGGLNHP